MAVTVSPEVGLINFTDGFCLSRLSKGPYTIPVNLSVGKSSRYRAIQMAAASFVRFKFMLIFAP